jgi:hypothetical protein
MHTQHAHARYLVEDKHADLFLYAEQVFVLQWHVTDLAGRVRQPRSPTE